jgi:hypothetical protein
MSTDRPEDEPDRGGSGPLIVMLVAFGIMCVGSVGGAGYFLWRAAENARERAAEARAELDAAAAMDEARQQAADDAHEFERVAKAMAEGLAAPERLADSYTPDGKPLLSWRVHLLPRLGHADLYRRFKLDEPWDGPNNKRLLDRIPPEYDTPGAQDGRVPGGTSVRGFSHGGAIFEPFARFTVRDLPAGPDNTLAIFDSGERVAWTRPDGLFWRPDDPRPDFGGMSHGQDWFLAATASGRVVRVRRSLADDMLRQLFDRRHDHRALKLPPGVLD